MLQIRHSDQEEQAWVTPQVRVALARQSSALPFLHLQLRGCFQFACGDTPIPSIDGLRLQSFLAYLVLHVGIPQSRTNLSYLLWPDSTEGQAHTNLRKLLPHADALVRVERHMLLWRNDGSWALDVLDFGRAMARAEQAEREGNPSTLRLALEQATELYQGELLPGCYDEWILPERERFAQLFLDVLERELDVGPTSATSQVYEQLVS